MIFEAYLTNVALYAIRGVEVGEYLKFPATTEEIQALLSRIEIDGKKYSEIFITNFESDVLGLYDYLDEYEDIDELNHLAHVLEEVRDNGELEKYEAALVLGKHTASVKDLINLAQNLNIYNFQPGIETWEALGCYYADELMTSHQRRRLFCAGWLCVRRSPWIHRVLPRDRGYPRRAPCICLSERDATFHSGNPETVKRSPACPEKGKDGAFP